MKDNKVQCQICLSNDTYLKHKSFPSYVEGVTYDIFECNNCNTSFIQTDNLNEEIYSIIYSQENVHGYTRYDRYLREIKSHKNPLSYLISQESSYSPVRDYIDGKEKLKILEIGCGNGYLSFALKSLGHDVVGIDISKEAIKKAIDNFGDYFVACDLKDFRTDSDFDLIIATQVIEHLPNPSEFISLCKGLLKKGGEILLTTPNKDYYRKEAPWKSESPPVHIYFLGEKSFKAMAERNNLSLEVLEPVKFRYSSINKLSTFILTRKRTLPCPTLDKNGKPYINKSETSLSRKFIVSLLMFPPIKFVCNMFYDLFMNKGSPTIGVILK